MLSVLVMHALRLVHENDDHEVYEEDEVEVVQVQYDRVNVFLGQYLKVRRGEPLVVPAPRSVGAGDLIDVEIAIDDLERFVLHAQLLQRWPLANSELAEVQLVAGRLTDRIVAPLVERVLGARHAAGLLRP